MTDAFLVRPEPNEEQAAFVARVGGLVDELKAEAATAQTRLWTAREFRRKQAYGYFFTKGKGGTRHEDMEFLKDDPDRLALFADFKAEVEAYRAAAREEMSTDD